MPAASPLPSASAAAGQRAPRIAIVTDIHHGMDTGTKRGSAAMLLMAEFRRFVADAKPDLVLDLGDRISDMDPDTDRHLQKDVREAFAPVEAPVFHIAGNHDRDFMTVAENEFILGQSLAHMSVDIGQWRIVLWRANTLVPRWSDPATGRAAGFRLAPGDLDWLAQTVAASDRPLLIASHAPFAGQSMLGNHYFEHNPESATYAEAAAIRAVLARANVPVVCIAGHVHWTTVTSVDGITHLTQQSLTEAFTTGEAAGAYGLLQLGRSIDWQVMGNEPLHVRLPASARRWQPPLSRFTETESARGKALRVAEFHGLAQPAP